MTGRVDKVEAAVDTVVNNVASVESTLIMQVFLKLLIYVLDNRLVTRTETTQAY